jgi:hypothetical protein
LPALLEKPTTTRFLIEQPCQRHVNNRRRCDRQVTLAELDAQAIRQMFDHEQRRRHGRHWRAHLT